MSTALSPLPAPGVAGAVPAAAPALSKRQKAAIVVRHLIAEGAKISLAELPDDLQTELIRQISGMRPVDRATLERVIDEFTSELNGIGLSFPGGIEEALSVLDGTISPATANRVRQQAGSGGGDPWSRIVDFEAEKLLPVMETESVEVAAILLAKLKVSKAAELLGMLPGERARRITYAVSQTGAVRPATIVRIGAALAEQLEAQPVDAFEEGPVERVGAILNFSPSLTRDDVLAGLQEQDSDFAEQVRKAIFTFGNIPERIAARDIAKIIRDVDQDDLITAIAAAKDADKAAADFMLANMSQRMADSLRTEAEERGSVTIAQADAAMTAVVGVIRELEANGEISLIADEEEPA